MASDTKTSTTDTDTSEPAASSYSFLALNNLDILAEVFHHIGPSRANFDDASDGQCRKDLFNAARTCQAFLGPALDALWRILPSLLPLFMLLPTFHLVEGKQVLDDIESEHCQWERFDAHARRVRILRLDRRTQIISPYICLRVHRLRSTPLIPALKEVRIAPDYDKDLLSSGVFLALSPEVEVVELNHNTIGNVEVFRSFFPSLVTEVPRLRQLILRSEFSIDIHNVLRFLHLERLVIHLPLVHLSASFIAKLGTLQDLADLTLHVGAPTPAEGVSATVGYSGGMKKNFDDSEGFQRLQKLHLIGSVSDVPRILRPMSFPSLSTFIFDENTGRSNTETGPFWIDCLETLANSQSLTNVKINQIIQSNHPLSFALITPLLHMQSLEVLEIHNATFSLSNEEYVCILSSLPNLHQLSLPDTCHSFSPSIEALLQNTTRLLCPNLEQLMVCVYVQNQNSAFPPDLVKEIKICRQNSHGGLRKLYISSQFGQLTDIDLIHLARLLDRAFPNLEVVAAFGPNAQYESWERVDALRSALQESRVEALADPLV